jgi:hypothetical protein
MAIESCIVAMIFGGLLIALNEPLAKLLHVFYHKVLGLESTTERLQRTKLIMIINGTIIMIVYAWNLRGLLTAGNPGN